MNIFDVHVNRAPMAGRVLKVIHRPGGFMPADRAAATTANERVDHGAGRTPGHYCGHPGGRAGGPQNRMLGRAGGCNAKRTAVRYD